MARKSINKSENNTEKINNNSAVPAASVQDNAIRKRGRPKGSGKGKGSRPDISIQDSATEETKQSILKHNITLFSFGKLKDKNNFDELSERISRYFSLCVSDNVLPTISGLSFALGIDRKTLWLWLSGNRDTIRNPACVDILKAAHTFIESQYEDLLTNGRIVPVSAFFLMKNNFGYKDTTEYTFNNNNNPDPSLQDISEKAGLLSD